MQAKLVRGKRKEPKPDAPPPVTAKVGKVLLRLRGALGGVERCRRDLWLLGYPRERWLEIVNSLHPEVRFAARPQIMDAIKNHLENAGTPLGRSRLVNELSAQGAAPRAQVQSAITANLRRGTLVRFPGNRVGLPVWRKKD